MGSRDLSTMAVGLPSAAFFDSTVTGGFGGRAFICDGGGGGGSALGAQDGFVKGLDVAVMMLVSVMLLLCFLDGFLMGDSGGG